MIYGKYKPGQIVTLKDGNARYVCRVIKSTDTCYPCSLKYNYIDSHCFYNIGTCAYKLIRQYYVEERSNKNTKC